MNLPEVIINKIISYVDDINSYQCRTCIKKISCICFVTSVFVNE